MIRWILQQVFLGYSQTQLGPNRPGQSRSNGRGGTPKTLVPQTRYITLTLFVLSVTTDWGNEWFEEQVF